MNLAKKIDNLVVGRKKIDVQEWDSQEAFFEYFEKLGIRGNLWVHYNNIEEGFKESSYTSPYALKKFVAREMEGKEPFFSAQYECFEGNKDIKHYFGLDLGLSEEIKEPNGNLFPIPDIEVRFSYKQKKD